jgi:hypothetical protein
VALVDDDMAEVVLGIVREEERGVGLVRVHVERLVGRDQDAGVLLGIVGCNGGRVGPEDVLHGGQPLGAELVAVADEEGAPELAGVGDPFKEIDGDKRFSGARGQGQESTLLAPGDLLQDRADRGILVIAAGGLPSRIADKKGPS